MDIEKVGSNPKKLYGKQRNSPEIGLLNERVTRMGSTRSVCVFRQKGKGVCA